MVLCATGYLPAPEASAHRLAALFSDDVVVIDLTHAVSAEAPYWPRPSESPFTHDTLSVHVDGAPRSGRFHFDNLADSGLPESGAYLIVAPIEIHGGSGGQVRVFAVVP